MATTPPPMQGAPSRYALHSDSEDSPVPCVFSRQYLPLPVTLDDRPAVICICGSMRFQDDMAKAAHDESLAGRIVVMPHVNTKTWGGLANPDESKRELDALHRAKIRMATGGILVVGNYIGDSTRGEIQYARQLGLPIRYTHPEVDPQ